MTLIRRTLAVAATLALAGCGEEMVYVPDSFGPTLNPASISAIPGDTVRLRITDAQGRAVRPTTLAVLGTAATVDSTALVTATTPGSAVVTVAVTKNGVTWTASVPITVLGFTLAPATATLAAYGGSVTLRPAFVGDSARFGPLVWTSTDTSVAAVAADGRVVGRNPGIVTITARSSADARLRADAIVTVACGCGFVQSLAVTPTSVTLQPGATQQLAATVTLGPGAPASTSRGVTYASSDTLVAAVSATGLITARRNGTATVVVGSVAAPTVTQHVSVTVRASLAGARASASGPTTVANP